MKKSPKLILRRNFIKTGLAGGAFAATFPVSEILSMPSSSQPLISNSPNSDKSLEKFREIVGKYGSEFGGVKPESWSGF